MTTNGDYGFGGDINFKAMDTSLATQSDFDDPFNDMLAPQSLLMQAAPPYMNSSSNFSNVFHHEDGMPPEPSGTRCYSGSPLPQYSVSTGHTSSGQGLIEAESPFDVGHISRDVAVGIPHEELGLEARVEVPSAVQIPAPFKLLSNASSHTTSVTNGSGSQVPVMLAIPTELPTVPPPPMPMAAPDYGIVEACSQPQGRSSIPPPPGLEMPGEGLQVDSTEWHGQLHSGTEKLQALLEVVHQAKATAATRSGRAPRRMDAVQAAKVQRALGDHPVAGVQRAHDQIFRLIQSSNGFDRQSLNIAIQANAGAGEVDNTVFWLSWMLSAGLIPSPPSLEAVSQLLTSAASQQELLFTMAEMGVSPTDHCWNQLIHTCVKKGDVHKAEMWLSTLMNVDGSPFRPTVISFNTVIHAHAQSGNPARAEHWLNTMIEAKLIPTDSTLGALVNAYAEAGDVEKAEGWVELVMREGWLTPNEFIFNGLIKACANVGDIPRAERWLQRMKVMNVPVTAITYNQMIHACGQTRDIAGAERYFADLMQSGEGCNIITYNAMINACATCGKTKRAQLWIDRMKEAGIAPDKVTYGSFCKALAREGQHEAVKTIINGLEEKGIQHNEYFYASWINACAKPKSPNPEEAERAFRQCVSRGLDGSKVMSVLERAVGRARSAQLLSELCAPPDNRGRARGSKPSKQGRAAKQ